uniref:ubiquitinyl hydrolase 1 n=1 Tax=Callorhinchus milii TaxID=7868 RepID=A0A4W3GX27_CALMI|eukprot:gi/632971250/ref/XP_007902079.1/ PREDICTED: ubiquitin thioesterase OTUB2 [Callorhinchus milii]
MRQHNVLLERFGVDRFDVFFCFQKETPLRLTLEIIASLHPSLFKRFISVTFLVRLFGNRPDVETNLLHIPNQDLCGFILKDLSKRYACFRRTLGDGNCFYRALSFAYLEALLGNSKGVQKLRKILMRSKGELLSMGFIESTFENAFNTFMDVIDLVEADVSGAKLLAVFNDRNTSDCLVLYLRLLTSAYLQKKSEFFEYFLEGGMSIKDFCTQEVEPMAMESDHIHITALTQALNIPIQVEYMDKSNTAVNHHIFPEGSKPLVYLLYKPGHYDILYKANKSK